ncbi:hypothetical protein B0A48_01502 [Cryoendolithus antarcticus]|uniref:Major facilitator superfamily (MFS) profile domain-containing protein n=1 Tax=Cryoendolithus antarcticus TaxID=1507870 RepID=A0A1V8TPM6_9PEZI|nr:hypothetical protein B0A48_01502 [Cryoendolithus antarcticus]
MDEVRIHRRGSIPIKRLLRWDDPSRFTTHLEDLATQEEQLIEIIDQHGFNWRVYAVAASGFFTDSYNLFVSNVVLPALAFVYWPNEHVAKTAIYINLVTLIGSAVGQVVFGFLADKYGRQRLYGIELFIVIVSTIGFAQCSRGIVHTFSDGASETSMSIASWLMAWRFVMGIGIGAEYPLSACITAEWSATQSRGRMLSAVFLMQPLGQLVAWLVGIAALAGLSQYYDFSVGLDISGNDHAAVGIDILWRIVVGVGAVPAAIAIIFRWTIPESGRYTIAVKQDAKTALSDTRRVYANPPASTSAIATDQLELQELAPNEAPSRDYLQPNRHDTPQVSPEPSTRDDENYTLDPPEADIGIDSAEYTLPSDEKPYTQFTRKALHQYFIAEGNWRYLAGTSLAWLILDFPYYGLGFNSAATMAKLWTARRPPATPATPSWLYASPYGDTGTVSSVLRANAKETLITTSIGSILGTLLLIATINHFDRRKALVWSFLALALALCVFGVAYLYLFHTASHAVLIVSYALLQFGFAFGPNTLTFILPAEIFPTKYRCTCYGISAAAGKIGSILAQISFLYFDSGDLSEPDSKSLGYVSFLYAGMMVLGAAVSWAWFPSVQQREGEKPYRLQAKTLEFIAKGEEEVPEGEKVGFRRKVGRLWKGVRRRR